MIYRNVAVHFKPGECDTGVLWKTPESLGH